ncbi:hypothetical protein VTK26DRAFT_7612 [Humicola hyalothermophila]
MDEAGRELLGLLDGLPLALAQAASYICETGLSTASYVRLYKQQWDDLMGSDGDSGSPLVDYEQGSVATTWTVSFKAVEAQNKNAANLLRLWAFVDGRNLWYGLLQAAVGGGEQWPGLGSLCADQGRLAEAESIYQRALEGYEKALGQDYISTLDTVNNLGSLCADQGRLTEAESMYQRALSGFRVALGPSHWKTQLVMRNLDVLLHAKGPSAITELLPPKAKVKILEKLQVKFFGSPKEQRRPPS